MRKRAILVRTGGNHEQAATDGGVVAEGSGWPAGQDAWWSDALRDPWRDPAAPAAVVVHPPADVPPTEPVPATQGQPGRRSLGLVFLVALVTALLAGGLGGTLGFVFAERSGAVGNHVVLGGNGTAGPNPASLQRPPDSLAAVVRKVLPSVVTVRSPTSGGISIGSGFVVTSDGYVITNDHVVEGNSGNLSVILNDASVVSATLVGSDPESDVAVLKANRSGLPPVQFGDSDRVVVGDPVLAFGSPLALANTVTYGIVSALDRPLSATEPNGPTRFYAGIQTDAAINHGNSGGPLVDAAGRVIGVNALIRPADDTQDGGNIGLAFAIPVNQAKRIAQEIIDTGHARRTVIGAQLSASYQNPNGGVEITTVTPGGPAANAGLQAGDIVLKLQGAPLSDSTDLIALVRKYPPGTSVTVAYQRNGASRTAQVTLGADGQ
jgi:putative serine protease PepD